jgi:DNA-binding response OmpR family regulator
MDAPHFLDEEDSDLKWAPGYGPAPTSPVGQDSKLPPKPRGQIRVLLVEDNLVDARLVQLALKHVVDVSFEVVSATTLSEALEHLAAGGFRIVLLDLALPDSWGLETIRRVREYTSTIPFIVLTGTADEEIAMQAIHQGAQDYLVKGANAATLTRAIRYAISRHRMRRKIEQAWGAAKVSEANQRMLIEKNLDGIVVVDREERVVHANAAAETLFAYPAGTFVGKRFPLPLNLGATRETDIVNCLSQVVPTELRVATIDWDGKPASLVLLRDLTEHRMAETNRHKMELAREVQQELFPKSAPQLDGFDIAGMSVTAEETGGDYFDYVPMPDGAIGLVVADASGHGIAAALLITVVSAYLRAFSSLASDPGQVLTRVAQMLGPHIPEGHFVTAVLASVDPLRRTVTYASAGHPSALLIDATGHVRADLTSLDLPVGLDPDQSFQSSPMSVLQPGDTLVLISDGIVEAMRRDGTLFGKHAVIELVRQQREEPAQTIVATLIRAVRNYSAPKSPADDLTAVVVKVL